MANSLPGDSSHHGTNLQNYSQEKLEEGSRWYFSRKEIEENSPSRRDGIDLKKETYLRKSYCTFLQDLGMRLKVPQLTIATSIIFCHRFFLHNPMQRMIGGLRTSLCLQFKPHHIAAGAIFLAAKFLKVKLPSDGEKVWWQEFDVTPRQLEEVSNQMLELYEQNRPSTNNEAEGSTVGGVTHQTTSKASSGKEDHATTNSHSQAGGINSRHGTSKSMSLADNCGGAPRATHNQGNEHASGEMKNPSDHNADGESSDYVDQGIVVPRHENMGEAQNTWRHASHGKEDQERNAARSEISETGELKDKHFGRNLENREGTVGHSPQDAIKKIDRDKVKAALEKRKKSRGDVTRKTDLLDEDDLIERELEAGIELAAESEKSKRDRRQSYSKPLDRHEHENLHHEKHQEDAGDGESRGMKGHLSHKSDLNMEEGEVPDDMDQGLHSPKSSKRKRKSWSPPDKMPEGKHWNDYVPHHYNNHDYLDDRNRMSRLGYVERDH
ncbi:hypothetical protein P3X46_030333 [Hevea brasiliensis]|uniref:B-like cyclin n=1 Tax=Hevea brasiliensis TaxID=3981 RepID=A0ABQ9KI67_HEVBR|nr:hypothetical protein P3X46_030333 [Hevea brasiliensis]